MCLLSPLNICLHGGPKASIVSGARFHLEKAKNSFEQITNIHTVSTTVFINENCFLTTLAVDRVLVRMRNATNGLITEASGHIAVPLITSNETYIVRRKKNKKKLFARCAVVSPEVLREAEHERNLFSTAGALPTHGKNLI